LQLFDEQEGGARLEQLDPGLADTMRRSQEVLADVDESEVIDRITEMLISSVDQVIMGAEEAGEL
jgi:hypothetical protein